MDAAAEGAPRGSGRPTIAPAGSEAPGGRRASEEPARMDAYLASFADNGRSPYMGYYPDLPSTPFPDHSGLSTVGALEDAFVAISDEIDALPELTFHNEAERIARTGDWDVVMLYERGFKNIANCRRCPTTTQVIRSHPTVRSLCGLVYVSRLRPGAHISAHHGPTNMRLRCHLALRVPAGDCALRVGDEVRRWEEGRCLVFDDSFEHEAWNRTAEDRVVLVVDLWHPDLSSHEIAMLEGLQRYATTQANSLSRYWAMNARARAEGYH